MRHSFNFIKLKAQSTTTTPTTPINQYIPCDFQNPCHHGVCEINRFVDIMHCICDDVSNFLVYLI